MTRTPIALVILAIMLSSCSAVYDTMNMNHLDGGFDLMYTGFAEIEEPDDIARWIYCNIDYEWDYADNWQSPKETMDAESGDCEDMAILYMNILYVRWGVKSDLVFVLDNGGRMVEDGGWYNHAVVRLPDGTMISAQGGRICHEPARYVYKFDEVFCVY